jgi:feruloyl-CoA hydratase/lyase
MPAYEGRWTTVRVEVDEGIGWGTLNRPEKRNAMSPTMNREMRDVLETLELDDEVKVFVLTGAGESWTAGMDLKEYFREGLFINRAIGGKPVFVEPAPGARQVAPR